MSIRKFDEVAYNQLTYEVIGLAIKVHNSLGPGLLESVYSDCLYYEIMKAGLNVEKEKYLPIIYQDLKLNNAYRLDLLIENRLVIELKSIDCITPIHVAQVLTYLRLGNYGLGLIINFNVVKLNQGIKRVVK